MTNGCQNDRTTGPARRARWAGATWLLVAVLGAAACTGQLGSGSSSSGGGDNDTGGPGAAPGGGMMRPTGGSGMVAPDPGSGPTSDPNCAKLHPGPAPLRRLTRYEYNNTVHELLGDTTGPAKNFPDDADQSGFSNDASSSTVSDLLIQSLRDAAESLATAAVADTTKLTGCATGTDQDTCARTFLTAFGKKAYRRPVADDELQALLGVYEWGKTNGDYATGLRLALEVILQAPPFLYRLEFGQTPGAGDTAQKLTSYEMATRLSYFFWASTPDDQLLAAADADQLQTPDQIQTQATRLIADDRAKSSVEQFYTQLLQLALFPTVQKDAKQYPAFNDNVRTAMGNETRQFIDYVVFQGDAKFSTLLTANYSFLNDDLATIYGVAKPGSSALVKTDLDPTQRSGLLTQPAMMSSLGKLDGSAPVLRGKFVREQLLCQPMPPPPANIPPPPAVQPGVSTRERFSQHSTDPACKGCHTLMDPVGFGFEHYDGIGAWRDQDGGKPVDASGQVNGASDAKLDGAFSGAVELAQKLVQSPQVNQCAVTQWFRFTNGRGETDEDSCSLSVLDKTFTGNGGDIRQLMVGLTMTDAFLYRPMPGQTNGGSQ